MKNEKKSRYNNVINKQMDNINQSVRKNDNINVAETNGTPIEHNIKNQALGPNIRRHD